MVMTIKAKLRENKGRSIGLKLEKKKIYVAAANAENELIPKVSEDAIGLLNNCCTI